VFSRKGHQRGKQIRRAIGIVVRFPRQARLAHAAGTGDGNKTIVAEQAPKMLFFFLTSEEARQVERQEDRRLRQAKSRLTAGAAAIS